MKPVNMTVRYRRRASHQAGFTLIEMLLAAAIFALVSMAGFQILTTVTNSNDHSVEVTEQLHGVQRAFFWIERDFLQITKRQVRVDGEAPTDKIFVGGELLNESESGAVSFTHDGWRNPGMILPRSEIQSVAYRMFDSNLERSFYNYPDPVTGEIPKVQILLEGIEKLAFEYFSEDGWVDEWDKEGLPSAVKVMIETQALGEIERVFMLVGATVRDSSSGMGLSRDKKK
jgi:general secretion pathway protein J